MAETLSSISLITFILSGVFFLAALTLFIVFKIPDVLGDLTGKNAKKTIERIRKDNAKSNKKKSDYTYSKKRKVISNQEYSDNSDDEATGLLPDITEVLVDDDETTLLVEDETKENGFEYIEDVMMVHTKEEI